MGIFAAVEALRLSVQEAGIDLQLTTEVDTHLDPDLLSNLRNGRVPTLADSRYLLLEPLHRITSRLRGSRKRYSSFSLPVMYP